LFKPIKTFPDLDLRIHPVSKGLPDRFARSRKRRKRTIGEVLVRSGKPAGPTIIAVARNIVENQALRPQQIREDVRRHEYDEKRDRYPDG
jgi:hypothetical protein